MKVSNFTFESVLDRCMGADVKLNVRYGNNISYKGLVVNLLTDGLCVRVVSDVIARKYRIFRSATIVTSMLYISPLELKPAQTRSILSFEQLLASMRRKEAEVVVRTNGNAYDTYSGTVVEVGHGALILESFAVNEFYIIRYEDVLSFAANKSFSSLIETVEQEMKLR